MAEDLFKTPKYSSIMEDHLDRTVSFLLENMEEFSIACQVKHVTFSPQLPQEILERFNETILFLLSGYTLQSAKSENHTLSFEAGFGENNFGSTVSVPLLAIKQVFAGEHPIVLNHAVFKEEVQTASRQNSMDALLNNPKNKKLLKK